ncbi:hypothetical protein CYMTET_17789 [Cymbomonas tetramitiformis]|uniref:Uncharacterized protein n=1 Tax=Cymbomonas tetramitiformis TaxID=36881 RepID=A0AAE0G9V1_9CHLO|nr:hypothetical protein CYMTET_17789 [Cymbomonas tetramitiformis]
MAPPATDDVGRSYLYSEAPGSAEGKRRPRSETPSDDTPSASPGVENSPGLIRRTGIKTPPSVRAPNSSGSPAPALPRKLGSKLTPETLDRWGSALSNMQDLDSVVESLSAVLSDAVYLEPDVYDTQRELQKYKEIIKVKDNKIATVEAELELAQTELAISRGKQRSLEEELHSSEAAAATLRHEQDNNAVVFNMHFNELLLKEEEIRKQSEELEKLKGIIEVLESGRK